MNFFMANCPFEKCWYVPFLREGGGSGKVYVLYAQLNVNNYGWPLNSFILSIVKADEGAGLNHTIEEFYSLYAIFLYAYNYNYSFSEKGFEAGIFIFMAGHLG